MGLVFLEMLIIIFKIIWLDGWSLTMEYKNYNTTKLNTSEKDNFVKNYDMNMIFTQPPTVLREHSSVFFSKTYTTSKF